MIQQEHENEIKRLEKNILALQRELAESQTRWRHSEQEKLKNDAKLTEAEGMIKKLTEKVRVIEIEKEELLLRYVIHFTILLSIHDELIYRVIQIKIFLYYFFIFNS